MNPDRLRALPAVQRFVKGFFEAGKPVAAICHGPWTLIDAGVVKGRTLTSYRKMVEEFAEGRHEAVGTGARGGRAAP